jgi:NADPH:quinone reductase-like Zn-dependent oxidoreductase
MDVRALIAMTAAVSTVLLAGCSGGDAKGACPTPATAPPAETALLPAGMSFDSFATVTHVQKTQGHLTVRAITAKPIDEVTVLIQDAVTAVGYRPAGMDNEGFEAEVFFTAGSYAAGQALVRRGACEGQWDIDLVLIDPAAVPSPTPTPAPTSSRR